MGHWAEALLDEAAAGIGPDVDRNRLKAILNKAGTEIDLLSGHLFGRSERRTQSIDSGGMPFAEVLDLQIGSLKSDVEVWPVADPVNPHIATVLQLGKLANLPTRAIPSAQALWIAGQLIGGASRAGRLSREYVLWWIGNAFDEQQSVEFLKRVRDPTNRINVPIVAACGDGWWFQVTRRLLWVTSSSADDQQLVEPLIVDEGGIHPLVAVEPVLIAARITRHPVDWAFRARIWQNVSRHTGRPWRLLARAIHGHGIPIMTIDKASTPEEIACQLVLLGHWHGYIGRDEDGLADAVAMAYPNAVERISRATTVPDRRSAASLLLEGLLHPGFDPGLGADSARRYVNRKARIAVLEHRKVDVPGLRDWEKLGISERFYYKLLKRFALQVGRRYQVDDGVLDQIRSYLDDRARETERHSAAMDLLQERGFTWAAARKWLQRHRIEDATEARPRARKGGR